MWLVVLLPTNIFDHARSVKELKSMSIPVWQPYLSKHKRQRTHLGEFECESFEIPHNGCPNVGYLIRVDGTTILYMTDMEYCPYDLSTQGINVALVELNYQSDRITEMDSHRQHTVLGHASETTTIEFLSTIKKNLRKVILCHMSKSGALDRDLAMAHIREVIPEYIGVRWARPGEEVDISEIPF